MSGSIFLMGEDGGLTELREQPYEAEPVLQELLARYPDLLAGDQVDPAEPRRWLLVAREAGIPDQDRGADRWSVDHLFLDQEGVPTLVEVKRSSDSRIRREVVGQMLDYAANVVLHWSVETIQTLLRERCDRERRDSDELLRELLQDTMTADDYWQAVKTNLDARRLRLLFVADRIPFELQRVVEFLNEQLARTQVLAIEVKRFGADGHTTLVPRVIGQTAAARQAKSAGSPGPQWDAATFYADLERRAGGAAVGVAQRLQAWAAERDCQVWWGRGLRDGSLVVGLESADVTHYLFTVWSYGRVEINFQYLTHGLFADLEQRRALRDKLEQIDGVRIADEALSKRPSISLSTLAQGAAVERFLDAFDWAVEQLRAAG